MAELFVIRLLRLKLRFGWEIRKSGGTVLSRSTTGFQTELQARVAGEVARAGMLTEAARNSRISKEFSEAFF